MVAAFPFLKNQALLKEIATSESRCKIAIHLKTQFHSEIGDRLNQQFVNSPGELSKVTAVQAQHMKKFCTADSIQHVQSNLRNAYINRNLIDLMRWDLGGMTC